MWLALALVAAVVFGLRGILYHWSALQPIDRNLVLLGTFATGSLICLSLGFILDQNWSDGSLLGLLMGLFTFGANLSVYKGFAAGKSSLPALFTSMSPVPVLLFSFLLWGETVNARQLAAFVIIVSGVVLIRYAGRQSLQRLQGMRWGLLALFFFALGDLSNKQASLAGGDPFPTLAYMWSVAAALFGSWWWIGRRRERRRRSLENQEEVGARDRPVRMWSDGKTFLWGSVIGLVNITGMVLLFLAFSMGVTGLVTAVVSLHVILILLYARFIVREPFRRTEMGGIALALGGMAVLHLFG